MRATGDISKLKIRLQKQQRRLIALRDAYKYLHKDDAIDLRHKEALQQEIKNNMVNFLKDSNNYSLPTQFCNSC